MDTPNSRSLYATQYEEAAELLKNQQLAECVRLASYNLTDPSLPRFYRMKNLLLIASADTDWYNTEACCRHAAETWDQAKSLTRADDKLAQNALRELREALDKLRQQQDEHAPAEVDGDRLLATSMTLGREQEEGEEEMKKADREAAELANRYGSVSFVTDAMQLPDGWRKPSKRRREGK